MLKDRQQTAMALKDTLGHAIANVMRRTIPEHTLLNVPESDKILLQNIVHLVQDSITDVNVSLMEVEKGVDVYIIRLPMSMRTFTVTLEQLRQIQAYSPARIHDASVTLASDTPYITLRVTTEARPLMYSEIDIIRIRKRRCVQ
jgi:hypothetical protein